MEFFVNLDGVRKAYPKPEAEIELNEDGFLLVSCPLHPYFDGNYTRIAKIIESDNPDIKIPRDRICRRTWGTWEDHRWHAIIPLEMNVKYRIRGSSEENSGSSQTK